MTRRFSTYRIWILGMWLVGFGVALMMDLTQQQWLSAVFHGAMVLLGISYYRYSQQHYQPEEHSSMLPQLQFDSQYCQIGQHRYHRADLVTLETGFLDQQLAFLQVMAEGHSKIQWLFPAAELEDVRRLLREQLPASLLQEADFHRL